MKRTHVDAHELRPFVEQVPDAYFLHDAEGRLLDVNQKACDLLGYSREELLQLQVFDLAPEFDQNAAERLWSEVVSGDCITFAVSLRRKDSSIFPTQARIYACLMGQERLYLVLAHDLTKQTLADDALRLSAEQYQTLFNSIDEGFCVVELIFDTAGKPQDYRFVEVNPAFEKHVGLTGAVGKTIIELVPHFEQTWIDIYGQVALTGQSVRFREYSPSLQRSFDVYAFRFGLEASARVAVLFANVTQRVLAEEALKKSEQLALIGRMISVISHEINNPLDAIQNLLYLAKFEQDPAIAREYITKAEQEVSAAAQIVSQTLKFTRRAGDAKREKLSSIVDSALALLVGKSKRAGVSLNLVYRDQMDVLCRSSELRQVFVNFLSNAFDATPAGGTVSVRVRDSSQCGTGEPGVRITLADTGGGMSLETQKHLSEAFYTTKGANGTGLGLWVSYEILARHGCKVSLKSRQSSFASGTVFVLWFPRNTKPPSVERMRAETQAA